MLSYFLVPKTIFYNWYIILGIIFMISLSLTLTCIIRNIKERIVLAKTYQSSILGIIATAIGISALQVCSIGAPVCGMTIGAGIFVGIFPGFMLPAIHDYAIYIVFISIILQMFSLKLMHCFKEV